MVNEDINLIMDLENSYTDRKNELNSFLNFVKLNNKELNKTLEKSFVLLLYANWEGYIKDSVSKYLIYISNKNIKIADLEDNFKIINLKLLLKNYTIEKNIYQEILLNQKLEKIKYNKFKIDLVDKNGEYYEKYILAIESNLKYKKYMNITKMIAYDFEDDLNILKLNLDKLIHNRNAIAHTGKEAKEESYLEIEDLENMNDSIVSEMENFKKYLQHIIKEKKYKKTI